MSPLEPKLAIKRGGATVHRTAVAFILGFVVLSASGDLDKACF